MRRVLRQLGVNKGLERVLPERESSHRGKREQRFRWVGPYNRGAGHESRSPREGAVGGCPAGSAEPSISTFLKALGESLKIFSFEKRNAIRFGLSQKHTDGDRKKILGP